MDSEWAYSENHRQPCRVIESQMLWGETICTVWLLDAGVVVRVPASRLRSLEHNQEWSSEHVAYVAAAGRIADALTQDVLLAPIEASVIPLPHQIRALSRALAGDRVRYLLADEVGLGKTIEAGLILRELKLRGLVRRTLIIAPKGLVSQWVAEMRVHFNEHFQLVLADDINTLNRLVAGGGANAARRDANEFQGHPGVPTFGPWSLFDQVVAPMDSVKPLDRRRGWTAAQLTEHNRERFEDLVAAGWDLVIVDEAHRLGGSTDQIARFKLGQGLAEAAPYLLLLSATPHQGKTDAFHRLVSLIDAQAFPDVESVTRARVQPYIIRTEKRQAINAAGDPLFLPRYTKLAPVAWQARHYLQQQLYEAVTEYVRDGYNQAIHEKRTYIGFLMLLMQRLVVSSTRAIRSTLERRLEVLAAPPEQLPLFSLGSDDDWADLDGQEQIELLLRTRLRALKNERAQVKLLLETAARCEQLGPDAKSEALLDWIYRLQAEEHDPELKVLVFTEFVPTQAMLQEFLTQRGFPVICLNGSMSMEERQRVQEAFAREVRILISTDAGGEGLNLQFCHVVINYDIPWNPMRLEQRIGRVDRIGQGHAVRAVNLIFEHSVEHRVRQVLEAKLAIIFEEFGIDKTGDVLDSAQAGHLFEDLYARAILEPDAVEDAVDSIIARLQEQVSEARATTSVLGTVEKLEPKEVQQLLSHPLPYWVERMTVSYLNAHGGHAEKSDQGWKLIWPGGEIAKNVVFSSKEAECHPTARHLTLEVPELRKLAMQLPRFYPGQPVPVVEVPGLPMAVQGFWSLWQIALVSDTAPAAEGGTVDSSVHAETEFRQRRLLPLFLADNGMIYTPTARHLWDELLTVKVQVCTLLDTEASRAAFSALQTAAEGLGQPVYAALLQEHHARIAREREKAGFAFTARRRAIERIGLPQVRDYRLNLLAQAEKTLREQLERQARVYPEMSALLVLRVGGTQ